MGCWLGGLFQAIVIVREEMRSIKKDTEQHPIALIVLSMVKSIPYVIPNTDVLRRFSVINGIGMMLFIFFVYRVPLSTILIVNNPGEANVVNDHPQSRMCRGPRLLRGASAPLGKKRK